MSFQASPLLAVTFGTLATTNLESTVLVAVCLFHLGTLELFKTLGFFFFFGYPVNYKGCVLQTSVLCRG